MSDDERSVNETNACVETPPPPESPESPAPRDPRMTPEERGAAREQLAEHVAKLIVWQWLRQRREAGADAAKSNNAEKR